MHASQQSQELDQNLYDNGVDFTNHILQTKYFWNAKTCEDWQNIAPTVQRFNGKVNTKHCTYIYFRRVSADFFRVGKKKINRNQIPYKLSDFQYAFHACFPCSVFHAKSLCRSFGVDQYEFFRK
jgi:hypothetical protein